MNQWFQPVFLSALSVISPMSAYCKSNLLMNMTNSYEKSVLWSSADPAALNKATKFLSYLGMSIDYEQDNIELVIANWMMVPENYRLFFEQLCKKINEQGDSSFENTIISVLEKLSLEWDLLARKRGFNDSLDLKNSFTLCSNSDDRSPVEEKRKEANDLFIEAAKDLVIGSIEIAEVILLAEISPLLSLPTAESAYEHLSDAWREIHECAEAYREVERLNREGENAAKEEMR